MKRNYLSLLVILAVLLLGCSNGTDSRTDNPDVPQPGVTVIGNPLADWSEGYLDIHAINTGRGECSLLILPDGTTMLVDVAGSTISDDDEIPPPPAKPNVSADPGQTVSNYVLHFIKAASNKLNYILISHWHADHIGGPPTDDMPLHAAGQFRICGITKVGSTIPFDKIVDRGFTFPRDMLALYSGVANYSTFVDWSKGAYSAVREEFRVGVTDQFTLQQNAAAYSNFSIRNLMCNGVIWTGSGTSTRNLFPSAAEVVAAKADENIFSNVFHLKYGNFDYFSGGDLQYGGRSTYSWFDVEAPVAEVMSQVEVMKASHHGTSNCNSDEMLKKLKPQTILVHVWRDIQPNAATLGRMFSANGSCNIFTTNMTETNKSKLGSSITSKLKSMNGHIVVRVSPGGMNYTVYVLDDTNENYKVKRVFGPFPCN